MTNEAQKKKPGLFGRLFGGKTEAPATTVPETDVVAPEQAQTTEQVQTPPDDERVAFDVPVPVESSRQPRHPHQPPPLRCRTWSRPSHPGHGFNA